jgi:hypothetical protein
MVSTLLKKSLPAWALMGVLICACAGQQRESDPVPPSFDLVPGKDWKLVGLRVENLDTGFTRDALGAPGALGVDFSNFYTLKFQDGMITGRAAPNNYRGPFELLEDQGITFNKIAATLMAPLVEPEGLKEGEYFKYLERVYRWDLRDGRLELYTKNEDGKESVLVFSE